MRLARLPALQIPTDLLGKGADLYFAREAYLIFHFREYLTRRERRLGLLRSKQLVRGVVEPQLRLNKCA